MLKQLTEKKKQNKNSLRLNQDLLKSTEDSITSGLEAAKAKLAAAREAGDINAEVEAQL